MPNMTILISNMIPPDASPDGTLHAAFICWVEDGRQAEGSFSINFGATVPAINAAIVDASKAAQQSMNGVTFFPADKMLIFGGAIFN